MGHLLEFNLTFERTVVGVHKPNIRLYRAPAYKAIDPMSWVISLKPTNAGQLGREGRQREVPYDLQAWAVIQNDNARSSYRPKGSWIRLHDLTLASKRIHLVDPLQALR